jgi:ribonuclease, rne/rng family
MMSLAPAAPLHLQIELAPAFAEAEPDIMAMAARVHALHRQVLGSLKGIQWHSAVHSTLSFEDGRTIEVHFGETGAEQIPEEFRQKQAPAQPARKPGQPGQRHGAPSGKPQGNRRHGSGRPGGKPGEGRQGKAAAGQGQAGNAPEAAAQDANAPANRQGRPHGKGRHGQPRRAEGGNRPSRNPADGKQGENTANAGNRPSQGPRRPRPEQEGRRNHEGRRGGQGERNGRSGGGFPSNSAMADKLRAALGGSFGLGKKDK